MKYLKLFENHTQYESYAGGGGMLRPNVSHCVNENEVHYNQIIHDYSKDYLTFVALEDGTFQLTTNAVNYSLDNGETWTELAANTATPTVTAGNKIMWKGVLTPSSSNGIGTFSSTGQFDAEGNAMSLLYGDEFKEQTSFSENTNHFKYLFLSAKIINAENLSLPATTLANKCYQYMFYNCTSLTTAPELPATTLAESCYEDMFQNCTSLTTAPELPTTTLAQWCYYEMFYGCKSLTTAPELPATRLSKYCYARMFESCTSLTTAPQLPATTLAEGCYDEMFRSCTSLTTAPELPATTLANGCYSRMFQDCTNITVSPQLSADTLADSCYYFMFSGTKALPDTSHINFNANNNYNGGIIGLFGGTEVTDSDLMQILPVENNRYYLGGNNSYSTKHMFANCTKLVTAPNFKNINYTTLSMSGMFSGCTSLTTPPSILPSRLGVNFVYENMFAGCTSLTTAPELPATTLADSCYSQMFRGCTSLTTAPELPATTLANYCYAAMFQGCTSITTAPELPATTLADYCYQSMFESCTSLTVTPELPVTTLTTQCYYAMFKNCTNLTTAPSILPATTLTQNCYGGYTNSSQHYGMFDGCVNLLNAPELPATTLVKGCYNAMFFNCKKIKRIKAMFTTTPSTTYMNNWVSGVSNTGTFIKNSAARWENTFGSSAIPKSTTYKWTVETASA